MDVIALHAAGFQNAVATLGTAITPDQSRLMKRYSDKVIISYDSDEAGRKAASKALTLLSDAGVEARVLKMDGAKDPDEYIKSFGAEKFKKLIGGSRTEIDFKIDGVKEKYDISVPAEKIKASAELSRIIASYPSKVERDIYIDKVAKILEVSPQSVRHDVERDVRKKYYAEKKAAKENTLRHTSAIGDKTDPDKAKNLTCANLEKQVLGMMILREDFLNAGMKKLTSEDFYSQLNKKLFCFMTSSYENGGFDIGQLAESFNSDEISRIIEYKASREGIENNDSIFSQCCERLKKETAKQKKKDAGSGDYLEWFESLKIEKGKK